MSGQPRTTGGEDRCDTQARLTIGGAPVGLPRIFRGRLAIGLDITERSKLIQLILARLAGGEMATRSSEIRLEFSHDLGIAFNGRPWSGR